MSSQFSLPLASDLGADQELTAADRSRSSAYGTDLTYSNGLVSYNGDYKLTTGLANLKAWVLRCLLTSPGEYKHSPNFGCGMNQFVKQRISASNIAAIKNTITSQMLSDRRIQSASVSVVASNSVVNVYVTIEAKGQQHALDFAFTRNV